MMVRFELEHLRIIRHLGVWRWRLGPSGNSELVDSMLKECHSSLWSYGRCLAGWCICRGAVACDAIYEKEMGERYWGDITGVYLFKCDLFLCSFAKCVILTAQLIVDDKP